MKLLRPGAAVLAFTAAVAFAAPAGAAPGAAARVQRAHADGHIVLVPFTTSSVSVFRDTIANADTAVIAVTNTGQEAASLLGTVTFLGSAGQMLDAVQASTGGTDEVQPGQVGYIRAQSTKASGSTSATFALTDSIPNETPDYVSFTVVPKTPTGTGTVTYPVTVTNTGPRPSHQTHLSVVIKDGTGKAVDVATATGPADDLAPGASADFTFTRTPAQPAGTFTYFANGSETAADVTYVSGVYDRKIVKHTARTTWTVLHANASGAPIAGASVNLLRYTQTTPPVSIGHGTTDAGGHISLPLKIDPAYIYTFYVEGGPTWAPDRYFHLTLNGDISLTIAKTSGPAKAGKKVTFKGKERPAYPGEKVVVEKKSGASWKSIGSAKVAKDGSWKLTTKFAHKGKVTLRVSSSPNANHFGTSSSTVLVTVR